jgi:hypothetical protein
MSQNSDAIALRKNSAIHAKDQPVNALVLNQPQPQHVRFQSQSSVAVASKSQHSVNSKSHHMDALLKRSSTFAAYAKDQPVNANASKSASHATSHNTFADAPSFTEINATKFNLK